MKELQGFSVRTVSWELEYVVFESVAVVRSAIDHKRGDVIL